MSVSVNTSSYMCIYFESYWCFSCTVYVLYLYHCRIFVNQANVWCVRFHDILCATFSLASSHNLPSYSYICCPLNPFFWLSFLALSLSLPRCRKWLRVYGKWMVDIVNRSRNCDVTLQCRHLANRKTFGRKSGLQKMKARGEQ